MMQIFEQGSQKVTDLIHGRGGRVDKIKEAQQQQQQQQ
jgi:hypothetical protein